MLECRLSEKRGGDGRGGEKDSGSSPQLLEKTLLLVKAPQCGVVRQLLELSCHLELRNRRRKVSPAITNQRDRYSLGYPGLQAGWMTLRPRSFAAPPRRSS